MVCDFFIMALAAPAIVIRPSLTIGRCLEDSLLPSSFLTPVLNTPFASLFVARPV